MTNRTSRLAPSPTGALHLGNARTFLVNWAIARNCGWKLLMRIEDLDGPRVRPEAAAGVLDTLAWLGIDHDGQPLVQSHDLRPYRSAMEQLAAQQRIFACELTRSQIDAAASAPHLQEHESPFPIALRPADKAAFAFARDECNYRFIVEPGVTEVADEIAGRHEINVASEVGDFVVWTKRGVPSYQLAVVVDDARQGVTDVVRGDDLLASAARQTLLYRALNLPVPRWWHLPLVLGPDGKRLAKRHGDTRIDTYRDAGVSPGHIIALLARWCSIDDPGLTMSAEDFRRALDLKRLSREPIRFSEDDDRWLRRN